MSLLTDKESAVDYWKKVTQKIFFIEEFYEEYIEELTGQDIEVENLLFNSVQIGTFEFLIFRENFSECPRDFQRIDHVHCEAQHIDWDDLKSLDLTPEGWTDQPLDFFVPADATDPTYGGGLDTDFIITTKHGSFNYVNSYHVSFSPRDGDDDWHEK